MLDLHDNPQTNEQCNYLPITTDAGALFCTKCGWYRSKPKSSLQLEKLDELTPEEIAALSPEDIQALIGLFNDVTASMNVVLKSIQEMSELILDQFRGFLKQEDSV